MLLVLSVLVVDDATEWIDGRRAGGIIVVVYGETLWRVLRMPWRGRFMCPLVVAGLGFRYFFTFRADRLGHPFKYPFLIALSKVAIVGLHNN